MADNNFLGIKVQTVIESQKEIENKLKLVLDKVNASLKINNIEFDNSAIKKIENLLKGLNSGQGINIPASNFTEVIKQIEMVKANGKDMLSFNGGHLVNLDEIKQAQIESDKLANTIGKVSEKTQIVNKLNEKNNGLANAKASNKVLDDNYKQIVSFQEKNKLVIDNIKKEFNGLYDNFDASGIDKLKEKLSNLSVKDENLDNTISKIKQEINALNEELTVRNKIQQSVKTSADNYVLNKANENNANLKSSYEARLKDIEAIKQEEQSQAKLNEAVVDYQTKMDNALRKLQASKNAEFIPKDQLNSLKEELSSLSNVKTFDEFTSKSKQTSLQFDSLTTSTKELRNEHTGLYSTLKHNLQAFSEFYIVGGLFMGIVNTVKTVVSEITEMDTALTNLNKVVDMSKAQMDEMKNSAIEMGKELGQSATSIVSGMAEWGRVTKDLDEIKELTKVSTLASNVTDLSVAQASKSLESAMIQFKLQTKDAMGVVDQWNEIQNNFAVSAESLADGIGKVGSVAQQSGMPIQELEGYITALVSSMKIDGNEAGTA